MVFPLQESNTLTFVESGVWVRAKHPEEKFAYSDGDAAEQYILDALDTSNDLSSQSCELDGKVRDWPSAYHLSSRRANLFRGIDLSGVDRALELGCGCGAITRYLGEIGIRVDAVDGSRRRAEAARRRCKGLAEVNVICSNFNSLTLPDRCYDAVFIIGVLEYAKRFSESTKSPHDVVKELLQKLIGAVKQDGVILIAIENRLGFKYLFGANEDHIGMRYVGVYGYPDYGPHTAARQHGIRTYDKQEWHDILDGLDGTYHDFYYPFPDYKLPEVVLSDSYVQSDRHAFSALSRIDSQDSGSQWSPGIDEHLFWEAAAQGQYLDKAANSFAIVVSKSERKPRKVINFDFVHFPDPKRSPAYRTTTRKLRESREVDKSVLGTNAKETESFCLEHRIGTEKYVQGLLLSDVWARAIRIYADPKILEECLKRYYGFIRDSFTGDPESAKLIDLRPVNIIVDDEGNYRSFDQEWRLKDEISPEFVYFRGVASFGYTHQKALLCVAKEMGIRTVGDFVEYCFELIGFDLGARLNEFIDAEERIQAGIFLSGEYTPMGQLWREELQSAEAPLYYPTVYWAGDDQHFSEEYSMVLEIPFQPGCRELEFSLPPSARTARYFRFDPADHRMTARDAFVRLHKILLETSSRNGHKKTLLRFKDSDEIVKGCVFHGLRSAHTASGELFVLTSEDPQVIMDVGKISQLQGEEELVLTVHIEWPQSEDYLAVRDMFVQQDEQLATEIRLKEKKLRTLETRISEAKIEGTVSAVPAQEATQARVNKSNCQNIAGLFRCGFIHGSRSLKKLVTRTRNPD